MSRPKQPQSAVLKYLHRELVGDDPERLDSLEEERVNANIARQIYAMRQEADLTQSKLAALVGTTPSVISRLEDADYEGHSLSMLRRVAAALHRRVEVHFVPLAEVAD